MKLEDIDYFEFNEAFAAQVIGCNREFNIDVEKINAVGSGISMGHPVGATGGPSDRHHDERTETPGEEIRMRLPLCKRWTGSRLYH